MDPGWRTEYAKSNRSTCYLSGRLIEKDALRVGVEVRSSFHDGFDIKWALPECVKGMVFERVKDVEMLRWDDQVRVRRLCGVPEPKDAAQAKKATDALWVVKDELADALKTADLEALMVANGYAVDKKDVGSWTHKAADGLLNGLLGPCPSCHTRNGLRWTGAEFICRGWQTEYVRCDWRAPPTDSLAQTVRRYVFAVPKALKDKVKYLKNWKPPAGYPTETIPAKGKESDAAASASTGGGGGAASAASASAGADLESSEAEDEEALKKPEDAVPDGFELYGMAICVVGTKTQLGVTAASLNELIEAHGGEVSDGDGATVCIASESQLTSKKPTKKIGELRKAGVPFLSVDWLKDLTGRKGAGIKLRSDAAAIGKYLLEGDSVGAPLYFERYDKARLARREEREAKRASADAERAKKRKRREPVAGSEILRVDPGTKKDKSGKIFVTYDEEYGYTPYNVAMNYTDLQTGVNKYYKMQIVQMPTGKTFYFWISYGRVGVDAIGDQKIYEHSEKGAIEAFEEKFLKFTGQEWSERDRFQKKPGKYYMIELDDGHEDVDDEEVERARQKRARKDEPAAAGAAGAGAASPSKGTADTSSAARPEVRELVKLIFDKTMMAKQLKSMDVDLKKMPLGKISKRQILSAYTVLTEIETALLAKPPASRGKLADLTTRFYTLVPHDFGEAAPPLIEDIETVNKKQRLLEALMDVSIAAEVSDAAESAADPVVAQYRALKCHLTPLDAKSADFKLISTYMTNQCGRFKVKLDTAFAVDRGDESTHFDTKKSLGNLTLLWHGSGLANYVGILSQGLRIAPPEAPVSGYRLGKGIYLADLFEKSASYCRSGSGDQFILIMLCEAGKAPRVASFFVFHRN